MRINVSVTRSAKRSRYSPTRIREKSTTASVKKGSRVDHHQVRVVVAVSAEDSPAMEAVSEGTFEPPIRSRRHVLICILGSLEAQHLASHRAGPAWVVVVDSRRATLTLYLSKS